MEASKEHVALIIECTNMERVFYIPQDDHDLLQVAADLGIEVNIRRKDSPSESVSLGQPYPIMDDPEHAGAGDPAASLSSPPAPNDSPSVEVPAPLPRVSSTPVFETPAEPGVAAPKAAPEAAPEAPPEAAPGSGPSSDGDGVRRQLMLEELAACRFRPFANQPVIRRRVPFERNLRQTTLEEFGLCRLRAKESQPITEYYSPEAVVTKGAAAGYAKQAVQQASTYAENFSCQMSNRLQQ